VDATPDPGSDAARENRAELESLVKKKVAASIAPVLPSNATPVQPPKKDSSSSSEEDSSSSSSSEEDSNSSSEEDVVIAKPLFVPKHKRGTVLTPADHDAAALVKTNKRAEQQERKQQESRALVQQVVTAAATAQPDDDEALEGITAARNVMPDDADDDTNYDKDNAAQDAWQVRELSRLLLDWDLEVWRRDEARELIRRRAMTDDERLREDVASGQYQRPGSQRHGDNNTNKSGGGGGGGQAQRYYHKGAFYMDESEWNETDIRHKADEYARAATGSDRVDKSKLPAVMQSKKFGFANQNMRYKGLAAEDTTDRQMQVLPLVHPNGAATTSSSSKKRK
jgi:microfibrillar-associated protein 1